MENEYNLSIRQRRISIKNLYLVGVISLGLIGLGVGSTFAMFTTNAEINNSISILSGLSYTEDIVDLVDMNISNNKVETATLNITNNTDKTLNYTSWYKANGSNLQIGTVVSNNKSVTGTIEPNETVQIIVSIRNRSNGVVKVTVGISASEDNIIVSDGITTLPTEPLPPYLSDYIKNLYTSNTKSDVTNNSITYHYAKDVNLMNDRLGGTTEDLDGGNIRYYGASPNNYIDIGDRGANDEVILWRIIGVFDGKLRIKRDESIGNYAFDSSASNVNNGYGINEWSQADLMKLLNPGFESNKDFDTDGTTKISVNNSLYWNSGSGNCYNDSNYTNTNCDFTNTGLSNEAKKYVVDQTLSLGGFNTRNVFANEAWANERGSNVVQNPSDGITRTLTWTGKVGLIYPSDFGYAADFSNENCQGDLSSFSNCTENWVNGVSWTVSPWTENANCEMLVHHGNYVYYNAIVAFGDWPTLLLNQNVIKESGTGTSTDPFVID